MSTCPCCGSEVDVPFMISVETNAVSTIMGAVQLAPTEFDLLQSVASVFPGTRERRDICKDIWGPLADGSESTMNHFKVLVSKLRSKLKPIGIEIVAPYNGGFRLVIPSTLKITVFGGTRKSTPRGRIYSS